MSGIREELAADWDDRQARKAERMANNPPQDWRERAEAAEAALAERDAQLAAGAKGYDELHERHVKQRELLKGWWRLGREQAAALVEAREAYDLLTHKHEQLTYASFEAQKIVNNLKDTLAEREAALERMRALAGKIEARAVMSGSIEVAEALHKVEAELEVALTPFDRTDCCEHCGPLPHRIHHCRAALAPEEKP